MSSIDVSTTNHQITAQAQLRPWRIGRNLLIAGAWIWLYWPVLDYLTLIFSREDFRTNQILLIGIITLIIMHIRQQDKRFQWDTPPQLLYWPLTIALGGSILYLLAERFLDVNTLSATLFGLSTYGLLGLWLSPTRWRQGLPAALLLIGTLPFGDHMQTFIGYPMRIITAAFVRDGLAAAGVASVGVDTILIFENGVSHVDLPCSGVKSLWTGSLFLLAATWIERRPLNIKWLLITAVSTLLFFITNIARVAILVTVGEVYQQQLIAEMLHIPLGVLGFAVVCATAVWLLRQQSPQSTPIIPTNHTISSPPWLTPILTLTILVMALLYTPRPQTGLTTQPPTWAFPSDLTIEPMPLKPDEYEWLTRDGAESADRHRFQWHGLSGSMILITSHTWRAHHRPERCFEVYGLSIDDSRTHLVSPHQPVRLVSLGNGQGQTLHSATYWFQSAQQTTDDYAARIWADLTPQRDRWVLVSILFDETQDPNQKEVKTLYTTLYQAVQQTLE